jgi:hypothetical protein
MQTSALRLRPSERLGEKAKRFFEVLFPVGPCVASREFLVFMTDTRLSQSVVERSVVLEEWIFGAAVEADFGVRPLVSKERVENRTVFLQRGKS